MLNTLISVSTMLMTTISPMDPYTIIEDKSELPLLNPDMRERQTLKLRLANGLQALIISDPKADQSAASLRVNAGSWSDPEEYPGMAHFCEHMLFMGTKKYPNENEFFSSISNYAGTSNAFTAPDRTVYMFSSQTDGFLALLDQFSHFFIDPLFNPENIARELHAVDQEFAKNIEHDGWREYMVFKELGNQNHPNRLFSTGNSETLGKIPQSALINWNKKFYSAPKMHLAVYSSLPMETLKAEVIEKFSQVPFESTESIDTKAHLSSSEQIGSITFIKPIQNRQSLTISWELPLNLSLDQTKSADLVAYALRRGQKYSLYEKLKNDHLIDSMSIHVDDLGGKEHRFFQISCELTANGISAIDLVTLRCFQAIQGLKETNLPSYIFKEKNTMAQLAYQYQERENPFNFIRFLGDSIGGEDLSTYPRNLILSTEFNDEKIRETINFLTPQNCSISLMASPELTKVIPDKKEKWMNAEYAIRPIPEKWMQEWNLAKPIDQIKLAEPNPYLPTQIQLASEGPTIPKMIANNELGTAYYVRSPEFQVPDIAYHIHILSPEINPTAESAVLTALYIDHITDVLHPTLASANAAGLSFDIDSDRSALYLQLSGYSEKAPLLLQTITKQMPLNLPTEEQFAIYLDRHKKAYKNFEKELTARQAKELLDSLVNQDKITSKDKLKALDAITYEDFLNFHKNLFEETYIQALFAGNLSLKEAESAYLDIIHSLGKSPFPKSEHSQTRILRLTNEGPFEINEKVQSQGNATLLLLDEGHFTQEKRATQSLLTAPLHDAFFTSLRSKQKTGYIAQSDSIEIEERLFHTFIVQSNSHQPDDLLFRFEQFIEEYNDSLSQNITKERFNTLKSSSINSLQTRFRNLKSKSTLWDRLAFEKQADFQFVDNRIKALENLSYEKFQEIAHNFLSRNNRRRLAILFEGKLQSPYAYVPITVSEINEVATYEPKEPQKALEEESALF